MATIPTNKSIKKFTLDGVEIPLAGGGSSLQTVTLTFAPTTSAPRQVVYMTGSGAIGTYMAMAATTFTLTVALNSILACHNVATMSPVTIGASDSYLSGHVPGAVVITSSTPTTITLT